jgi:dipeptidyl aminopeptidase/acylaminoacyl peptidase
MRLRLAWIPLFASLCLIPAVSPAQSAITLDEFLNTAGISQARLSPDGWAAVITTGSPDWAALAAAHGWLVFRPNYRGSAGCGDGFMLDKAKTPIHPAQGGADVRVSYLEGVTMERSRDALGIAHSFLVFPGEGHGLRKNPWHGCIKLRDELKWLDKYDGK